MTDEMTRALDIYTAAWRVGHASARAGLDWRASWFNSADAAIAFSDGALAYELEQTGLSGEMHWPERPY